MAGSAVSRWHGIPSRSARLDDRAHQPAAEPLPLVLGANGQHLEIPVGLAGLRSLDVGAVAHEGRERPRVGKQHPGQRGRGGQLSPSRPRESPRAAATPRWLPPAGHATWRGPSRAGWHHGPLPRRRPGAPGPDGGGRGTRGGTSGSRRDRRRSPLRPRRAAPGRNADTTSSVGPVGSVTGCRSWLSSSGSLSLLACHR